MIKIPLLAGTSVVLVNFSLSSLLAVADWVSCGRNWLSSVTPTLDSFGANKNKTTAAINQRIVITTRYFLVNSDSAENMVSLAVFLCLVFLDALDRVVAL
jgi:hypothetical protein